MSLKFWQVYSYLLFRVYHPCCGTEYTSSASPYREERAGILGPGKKGQLCPQKPLDGLDYVKIPLEKLPMNALSEDEKPGNIRRF